MIHETNLRAKTRQLHDVIEEQIPMVQQAYDRAIRQEADSGRARELALEDFRETFALKDPPPEESEDDGTP